MGKARSKDICSVPNCPSPNGPGSMFQIPANRKEEWLTVCNIKENDLRGHTKVCYLHFKEDEVIRKQEKNFLLKGVVPT